MTLKPSIHRYLLRLPHIGRQISDEGWHQIEPTAITELRRLQDHYSLTAIACQSREYRVRFDFSPVLQSYADYIRRHREFEKTKDHSVWSYYRQGDHNCFVEVEVSDLEPNIKSYDLADQVLQIATYEVFLAMCLPAPGTFNLDGAEYINVPERRSINGSVITYDVDASSSLPENYHYEIRRNQWIPQLQVTSMQALSWLNRSVPRFSMLADNPSSRCVFALLYLCKGDPYSGAGSAWLFNALESLFGCKPGENKAALIRRITTLLEITPEHVGDLRRIINELYDIRSAFVHGGLATVHPIREETLDKRVDDEIIRVMQAIDRGITLLITVLRKLIVKDMMWPQFEETLVS